MTGSEDGILSLSLSRSLARSLATVRVCDTPKLDFSISSPASMNLFDKRGTSQGVFSSPLALPSSHLPAGPGPGPAMYGSQQSTGTASSHPVTYSANQGQARRLHPRVEGVGRGQYVPITDKCVRRRRGRGWGVKSCGRGGGRARLVRYVL